MAEPESAAERLVNRPTARARALMLLSFVIVFSAACVAPAFHLDNEPYVWRGVHLLVLGVMGLKIGLYGWLANIPAALALRGVMQGWGIASPALSVLAMLIGLHTLRVFGRDLQVGEHAYNIVHVVALGPGFYLWLLALLHPFFVFMLMRQRRVRRPPAADLDG